jgi:hypothetical protein
MYLGNSGRSEGLSAALLALCITGVAQLKSSLDSRNEEDLCGIGGNPENGF